MKLIRVAGSWLQSGGAAILRNPPLWRDEVRATIAPSTRPPPTRAVSADPPGSDVNGRVATCGAAVRCRRFAGMGDRLAGKVTIVTGAGSGIGRASAIRFAEEGARVTCVDVNRDAVEAVARRDRGRGVRGRPPTCRSRRRSRRTPTTPSPAGAGWTSAFNNAGDQHPGRVPRGARRGHRPHPRRQRQGLHLRLPLRDPAHARRRRRLADQHDVGQRPRRRAVPRDLRHLEGRDRDAVEGHRPRLREAGHPLQRARPGLGRHADQLRPRRDARRPPGGLRDDRFLPADRPAGRAARDRERRAVPRLRRVVVRHRAR